MSAGAKRWEGAVTDIATYDDDLYSDEAIVDPYGHYQRLRDLGPLVYLSKYDVFAISRFADVKGALLAHTKFRSGKGVAGFTWPEAASVSNTLISDEPDHSRFRQVIGTPLQPPSLEVLTEQFETAADDLIKKLVEAGGFDGITDLARFLPVSIVSSLVGLPERGRERMLDWAAAAFDILGVDNDRAKAAFGEIGEMISYVMTECRPDTVKAGSLAAQIWEAVEKGQITPQEAGVLHTDLIAPSLDTTIFATGHLLHRLATNPDQWARVKSDPSLIPAAIEEAVRLEAPIRAFGRVVEEDEDVGGSVLPAGSRVLLFYASAYRDERQWEEPERFWIERPGLRNQLGFGYGRHTCAGMHLARLEMRSLLKAIVERVDQIEVGEPQYQLNNVLRGFSSLPARFIASV